jgi:hypothetical protein
VTTARQKTIISGIEPTIKYDMHILNAVEDENTPFRHDGREIRFTKVKATELISQPTAHEDEASSFTETILSTFQVFCFL